MACCSGRRVRCGWKLNLLVLRAALKGVAGMLVIGMSDHGCRNTTSARRFAENPNMKRIVVFAINTNAVFLTLLF